MIRTSSTINGEILIANEIPHKNVLKEIQNMTPIDLNSHKPTYFSTVKNSINDYKNLSCSSDDINNSENTKIIGSGPSEFENDDDTISSSPEEDSTSITSTMTTATPPDIIAAATITTSTTTSTTALKDDSLDEDDEEEQNLISYDLIKEFLVSQKNNYRLEDEIFEINEEQFLKSIEIVETFNKVACGLYATEIDIKHIDFKLFLKSVFNTGDKYFNKTIDELVKLLIHANQDILNEMTLFGLNIFDVVNHQLELSIKTKVLILFKIFSNYNSNRHSTLEKSGLFNRNHNLLEERIEHVEDLIELSSDDKLDLLKIFIDFFVSKKVKFFRSKLDQLENSIQKASRDLQKISHQRKMLEFQQGNLNYFLFDKNDSLNEKEFSERINSQLNEQKRLFISLNQQFENIMRTQPFSQVFIQDCDFVLQLWHFECLKNSLMIEKRFISQNYSFEKANFDFNLEKSEWFLITDPLILKQLMVIISSNIIDSNFDNGILKVIDKSYINSASNEIKNVEEVQSIKYDDYDSTFLVLLNDFKERLVESNFIHFELVFDKDDNSVKGFTLNEFYHKYDQKFSSFNSLDLSSKEEKINFYSNLVLCLYGMISRKFINKKFLLNKDIWEVLLINSKSLEQIKLCVFLLDKNVHWEKTQVKEICKLCTAEYERKNIEDALKIRCKNCSLIYHVDCLLKTQESCLDANNNEIPIKIFKSKLTKTNNLLCFSCEKNLEEELKVVKKINEQKCQDVAKELTSIEVNNYCLRFNKLRVTNLDNKIQKMEQIERRKERRAKKSFIASSTDDAKSTDSDYVPKRKKYERIKVVESSSSSSIDGPKKRGRAKKRKENDKSSEENDEEAKSFDQNNAENEVKRARLGLRIRPRKIERLF